MNNFGVNMPAKDNNSSAAYILLDRSGSMENLWVEMIGAINGYVRKLGLSHPNTNVTVALFDSTDGVQVDVIRSNIKAGYWVDVNPNEQRPRGGTPLFDAIGRFAPLAESFGAPKTAFVVVTDGYENSSREITRDGAKNILDRLRSRNWDVVFLGADFDAFSQSSQVGIGIGKTLNMSKGVVGQAMNAFAATTTDYYAGTRSAETGFTAADRAIASGQVTNRAA